MASPAESKSAPRPAEAKGDAKAEDMHQLVVFVNDKAGMSDMKHTKEHINQVGCSFAAVVADLACCACSGRVRYVQGFGALQEPTAQGCRRCQAYDSRSCFLLLSAQAHTGIAKMKERIAEMKQMSLHTVGACLHAEHSCMTPMCTS